MKKLLLILSLLILSLLFISCNNEPIDTFEEPIGIANCATVEVIMPRANDTLFIFEGRLDDFFKRNLIYNQRYYLKVYHNENLILDYTIVNEQNP